MGSTLGELGIRFENMNGCISSLVHGTKNLGVEIVKNINIAIGAKFLKSHILKTKIPLEKNLHDQSPLESMLEGQKIKLKVILKILDANKIKHSIGSAGLEFDSVLFYKKARILKKKFTSEIYKENKTNSCSVEITTHDDVNLLGSIVCFIEFNQSFYVILRPMSVSHNKMFLNPDSNSIVNHILPVVEDIGDNFPLINFDNIKCVEKLFNVWSQYFCRRPNYIISTIV